MKRVIVLVSIIFPLIVISCDTGPTQPEDVVFPESNVSYVRHVQPLFDVGCNFSGCHNSVSRAGGLSLASYFDLINKPGVVLPGDADRSLLVQVIRQEQPHTFLISSIVTSNQARGVALWVDEGASNN